MGYATNGDLKMLYIQQFFVTVWFLIQTGLFIQGVTAMRLKMEIQPLANSCISVRAMSGSQRSHSSCVSTREEESQASFSTPLGESLSGVGPEFSPAGGHLGQAVFYINKQKSGQKTCTGCVTIHSSGFPFMLIREIDCEVSSKESPRMTMWRAHVHMLTQR